MSPNMKTLRLAIMTTFISSLFGCKTNNQTTGDIFPKESFSVVEGTTAKNKQLVGSINMAYKNYDNKAKYPWCLTINMALELENLYDNGLPKDNESKIANQFEDELISEIKKLSTSHYIGHLFNDTFLDIYVYLDKPEKVNRYLQTQVNKKDITRPFRYEIKEDPLWSTVQPYFR